MTPVGAIEVVTDFLPAPSDLAYREVVAKVTLALSKTSVDFFKSEAQKHQTQYPRMICGLLDSCVAAQGNALPMSRCQCVHRPVVDSELASRGAFMVCLFVSSRSSLYVARAI
jgi:hypothetical protein